MKKKLKPIVFKSSPGAFTQTLLEAEIMVKKFRSTNLDFALRKAIEDGWLFVMPEGKKFAYCRGTGPVGLQDVRLGHHEKQTKDGTPDWNSPRVLVATYSIVLFDGELNEDQRVTVDIAIPSKFTDFYVERSEEIPHNPKLTRLEFVYKVDDLRVWMREKQMTIYGKSERWCHDQIRNLKKRIEEIRDMSRGEKKLPYQSAFD